MEFEQILQDKPEAVQATARTLREMIRSLDADISEAIGGGTRVQLAHYSIGRPDNMIAVISPSADHCKLYLHHFSEVDTGGLKLHGKGRHSRHVKFKSAGSLPESELIRILRDIWRIARERH